MRLAAGVEMRTRACRQDTVASKRPRNPSRRGTRWARLVGLAVSPVQTLLRLLFGESPTRVQKPQWQQRVSLLR
jgi:hypothetical protein